MKEGKSLPSTALSRPRWMRGPGVPGGPPIGLLAVSPVLKSSTFLAFLSPWHIFTSWHLGTAAPELLSSPKAVTVVIQEYPSGPKIPRGLYHITLMGLPLDTVVRSLARGRVQQSLP
ncbi:hypothetical protein CKAH01_16575 [Colletotrichum kahawae]|uniref:Uncharacterized protein n=1 Tax=Colletotrichum kahawae TaxID=34407 RepID=A0AAE0D5A5_COLKA|nr:hypothetical protein CKAH01_16575 [Colletotrichum kahawae]